MAKRPALGKGLGAILGEPATASGAAQALPSNPATATEVALDKISPNPYQPREHFDEEAIAALADSIRRMGIIQPLTLRKTGPDSYQIISGERRYRASRLAGLESVPAYIREAEDGAMVEMALVENIQREDLDPIETALSFRRLAEEFSLTQEQISEAVGKSRAHITNTLRLLQLPPAMQKSLRSGELSTGHAKVLLSVEDAALRDELYLSTLRLGWSVRRLEERIRERDQQEQAAPASTAFVPESFVRAVNTLSRFCDGRVALKKRGESGGTLTLKFKDSAQLEHFLNTIEKT